MNLRLNLFQDRIVFLDDSDRIQHLLNDRIDVGSYLKSNK